MGAYAPPRYYIPSPLLLRILHSYIIVRIPLPRWIPILCLCQVYISETAVLFVYTNRLFDVQTATQFEYICAMYTGVAVWMTIIRYIVKYFV